MGRQVPAPAERPRRRAVQQRDELAPSQLIELHSNFPPTSRIAEYRITNGQSAGMPQ